MFVLRFKPYRKLLKIYVLLFPFFQRTFIIFYNDIEDDKILNLKPFASSFV